MPAPTTYYDHPEFSSNPASPFHWTNVTVLDPDFDGDQFPTYTAADYLDDEELAGYTAAGGLI